MSIPVVVAGGRGRIGSVIVEQIEKSEKYSLAGVLDSSSTQDDRDTFASQGVGLLVDATSPDSSLANINWGLKIGANVLVATSGWDSGKLEILAKTLDEHPGQGLLIVPNFSIGSILATKLSTLAAVHFPSLEISETHHAKKKDAPSGTAVRSAEKIIAAITEAGQVFSAPSSGISGDIDTSVSGINVHSYRRDGVPTSQQVDFYGTGEAITINHQVFSYDAYRPGIDFALNIVGEISGLHLGLDKFWS